jgi:hypothetical protein
VLKITPIVLDESLFLDGAVGLAPRAADPLMSMNP